MAPSEFWGMEPVHFWWLLETLNAEAKPSGLSEDDAMELRILLAQAERGEF